MFWYLQWVMIFYIHWWRYILQWREIWLIKYSNICIHTVLLECKINKRPTGFDSHLNFLDCGIQNFSNCKGTNLLIIISFAIALKLECKINNFNSGIGILYHLFYLTIPFKSADSSNKISAPPPPYPSCILWLQSITPET